MVSPRDSRRGSMPGSSGPSGRKSRKAKSVKRFQSAQKELMGADQDDDMELTFDELLHGELGALLRNLGLTNASDILREFDVNGDGVLDRTERATILGRMVPALTGDVGRLKQAEQYEAAFELAGSVQGMRNQLEDNFLTEQKRMFEESNRQLTRLASHEQKVFGEEWEQLAAIVNAHFDAKLHELTKWHQLKTDKFRRTEAHKLRRTGPMTPKLSPLILELKTRMRNYAQCGDFDEAGRIKRDVDKAEAAARKAFELAHAKHVSDTLDAMLAEYEDRCERMESTRSRVLGKIRGYKAYDAKRLASRHNICEARLDHARHMAMSDRVLLGWPNRIPHLPEVPHKNHLLQGTTVSASRASQSGAGSQTLSAAPSRQSLAGSRVSGNEPVGNALLATLAGAPPPMTGGAGAPMHSTMTAGLTQAVNTAAKSMQMTAGSGPLPVIKEFRPSHGVSNHDEARHARYTHNLLGLYAQPKMVKPEQVRSKVREMIRPSGNRDGQGMLEMTDDMWSLATSQRTSLANSPHASRIGSPKRGGK